MDRSHGLSLAFVVVLVAGVLTIPGVVAGTAEGLGIQQTVDPDRVNLDVGLEEDGSANWEIQYFVRLRTDNETQAFEDLMADVDANRSAYIDRFADRMNATVASAENETGRSMTATDFTVDATIQSTGNTYGVLTYTFTWTNFAQVSDETVTAGDALAGFYLDDETTLQFTWPDGYQVTSVSPEPTSTSESAISWRGPLDFLEDQPSLDIEPVPTTTMTTVTTSTTGTTTTTETPGTGTPTTTSEEAGAIWPWLIGGIVVLAILAGALWYWQGRGGSDGGDSASGDEAEGGPTTELMSNEERVEEFLSNQGGRAKQQEIVDGLGWTEAKTSQVLSDMQEGDRIEKFRIGRENVVKLPDTDGESE